LELYFSVPDVAEEYGNCFREVYHDLGTARQWRGEYGNCWGVAG